MQTEDKGSSFRKVAAVTIAVLAFFVIFGLSLKLVEGLNLTILYAVPLCLLWAWGTPRLTFSGLLLVSIAAMVSLSLRGDGFAAFATTFLILLTFWVAYGLARRSVRQDSDVHAQLAELKSEFKALARRERNATLQAELAKAARSDLLTSLSHELRTPLNAILGFADIIQQERFGPLENERYKSYIGHIGNSGAHLLRLIDNLLDVCNLETGKIEVAEGPLDPGSIITERIEALTPEMQAKRIAVEADLADSPRQLLADGEKFRQILDNLLSNAIAFTDEGGKVNIRAWCHDKDGYVIQVDDTGVGIRLKEVREAIRPFGLVNGTRNKLARTGLGLTISKSLVELHAGSMDVQSRPGGGTCVTLRFPAQRTIGIDGAATPATA